MPVLLTLMLLGALLHPFPSFASPQDRTLQETQALLRESGAGWTATATSVSDIPWEQFRQRLGLRVPADYEGLPKIDLSREKLDLPSRWDWREHGGTSPVKDQGQCGSCWAFAAAATFEAAALRHDHFVYDLSEQELLACNPDGYGCNGGWFDGCYDVFHDLGAVSEECLPYQARDGIPCAIDTCERVARASDLIWLAADVPTLKAAIYEYGAVATGMEVVDDFRYYGGGCYEHPGGGQTNHAVSLVGWDDEMCGGAWIAKNSWGTGWGLGGYFYIQYRSANIGSTSCVFVHVPGRLVQIDPEPLAASTTPESPVEFRARVVSRGQALLVADSLLLCYRLDGGPWQRERLRPGGEKDLYTARIPGPGKLATVDYYFCGADLEGHHGFAPVSAPDSVYTLDFVREWQDFEGGCPGWHAGGPEDDATSGIWELAAPIGTDAQPGRDHTPGGARCWITGQQREGEESGYNDVDGGRTTLYSPAFDFTGSRTAVVKYWRWFSNDKGTSPGEDAWVVQARADGGEWVDIENTRESSDRWVQISCDLMPLLGPEIGLVEFRFIASDEGFPSCVEAALDDFEIQADDRQTSRAPEARETAGEHVPTTSVDATLPNPAHGPVCLRFGLPVAAPVTLTIFDPAGRKVRELDAGFLSRGMHELRWDLRDGEGRMVGAGRYFWRVEAGSFLETRTVVVVP